jgi:PEP-CTERM motif
VAACGDFHIYRYHIPTGAVTQEAFVNGLDDLAPLIGSGSLVPEPSSMISLALGLVGIASYATIRRRSMTL